MGKRKGWISFIFKERRLRSLWQRTRCLSAEGGGKIAIKLSRYCLTFALIAFPQMQNLADLIDISPTADAKKSNNELSEGNKTNKVTNNDAKPPLNPSEKESKVVRRKDGHVDQDKNKEKEETAKNQDILPVHFGGDGLSGTKQMGYIKLLQNVSVSQGDMSLKSESAKIFFNKITHEVEQVIASGSVTIKKQSLIPEEVVNAQSDQAKLDARTRLITLKGNAVLKKGNDTIKGEIIDYNIKTGWISARKVKGMVKP